jgi:isochorismate pyruvate lyase
MPLPADCKTKDEIRSEIDRLDRELVALLAVRFAYVRRMAELKSTPADALDQRRVDDVLTKVAAEASRNQLDPGLIRSMWRPLIDWNIAWEAGAIGKRTGTGS